MFSFLEAWLTERLLRQPGFHRAVGFVHKRIHQLKTGQRPEELGGTNVQRNTPSLAKHFLEELKTQINDIKPGRRPPR